MLGIVGVYVVSAEALNRRLRQADEQLRRYDFRLENLIGFDLHGKIVGIVGCGRIGGMLVGILHGFGCRLLEFNVQPNEELTRCYDMTCVPLEQLCAPPTSSPFKCPPMGIRTTCLMPLPWSASSRGPCY